MLTGDVGALLGQEPNHLVQLSVQFLQLLNHLGDFSPLFPNSFGPPLDFLPDAFMSALSNHNYTLLL